jgi:hypothetical protein
LKRSYKSLYHLVCKPDLLLYLSRMREAPSPDFSVREKLAILHRWESTWDDHHNDNNEEDPDSCVLDLFIEMDAMDYRRADLCGYGRYYERTYVRYAMSSNGGSACSATPLRAYRVCIIPYPITTASH